MFNWNSGGRKHQQQDKNRYIDQQNNKSLYREPVYKEPEYKESVYKESVYKKPVYKALVHNEFMYSEPVYKESIYREPVYKEPVYEELVYKEPMYREPLYDEPAYENEMSDYLYNNVASSVDNDIADAIDRLRDQAATIQTALREKMEKDDLSRRFVAEQQIANDALSKQLSEMVEQVKYRMEDLEYNISGTLSEVKAGKDDKLEELPKVISDYVDKSNDKQYKRIEELSYELSDKITDKLDEKLVMKADQVTMNDVDRRTMIIMAICAANSAGILIAIIWSMLH